MQDTLTRPLLSIAVPTYNHGDYIAKALDSILMQKTDFEYEIVIGDDCSTDQTCEILETYKSRYPDKIHLFLSKQNEGVCSLAANLYKNCRGKYIAIIEGDDYWTYECKLQEQINFLENNPDYAGSFHDAEVVGNYHPSEKHAFHSDQCYTEYKYYSQFNRYHSDFFPWNLLQRNIIPSASLVFRNNHDLSSFFTRFSSIKLSLQWALHLYIIKGSKFNYFNAAWSAYNDHPQGVTKKNELTAFNRTNLAILKILRKDNYYRYCRLDMNRAFLNEYREILYSREASGFSFSEFLKYFLAYRKYTIKLFFSEAFYFRSLRRKKNK
jgi:glycosyltransferase involved in cell wall biosynthesis